MQLIERNLKFKEIGNIFDLIKSVIEENENVQIHIDRKIRDLLGTYPEQFNVKPFWPRPCGHYTLLHSEDFFQKGVGEDTKIVSFVKNSKDYMQVVQYKDSGKKYTHFRAGMDNIVVFHLIED